MIVIPIDVILSWPARNTINPVKRGPELWIVSSIFFPIATLCVGTRLYSRIFIRGWFGPDDALILIAFVGRSFASCHATHLTTNTSK
jgi:hypothetical protein